VFGARVGASFSFALVINTKRCTAAIGRVQFRVQGSGSSCVSVREAAAWFVTSRSRLLLLRIIRWFNQGSLPLV
jgi:hypothetical protein